MFGFTDWDLFFKLPTLHCIREVKTRVQVGWIYDRRTAESLQDSSERCYDAHFGDSGTGKEAGGQAGGGEAAQIFVRSG